MLSILPQEAVGRLDTQAEKAQCRFHQDGIGNVHGCSHDNGRHDVRQDMMYNGGEFLLSGDLCIDDILSLVQGNGLATDDPGNIHPGQKADDQDNVLKSRFQEGIHNDHDQECRKTHQCIHQTHQHRIHRSSHKTADGTDVTPRAVESTMERKPTRRDALPP